jgi:hypothetical protein
MNSPTPSLSVACINGIMFFLNSGSVLITKANFRIPLQIFKLSPSAIHNPKKHLWKKTITHFLVETYRAMGIKSLADYKKHFCSGLQTIVLKTHKLPEPFTFSPAKVKSLMNEVEAAFVHPSNRIRV